MLNNGILIPLVTPLDADGQVCEQSVARLIESTHAYAAGYIPCLTSGEGWKLSERQWRDMLCYTLRHAGKRVVIAGIEQPTTQQVLTHAQAAQELGATACMLTSPFGADISQSDTLAHYRAVHDATEIALYIYNESALSGNRTELQTLLEIANLPRVVGIKDSGDADGCSLPIAEFQGRGVAYYVGWESRLQAAVEADGCVVSLSNLEPGLCVEAMRSADRAFQSEVNRLCQRYSLDADDWYRHVKVELKRRGVIDSAALVEGGTPPC